VKKLLSFFVFIVLFGCSNFQNKSENSSIIDCPPVFFSSENKIYVQGDIENIDLNQINYKASLNNYGFLKNCTTNSITNNFSLDLLILVEPINPINKEVNLPLFAIIYDSKGQIIDKQFFRVRDGLNYNKSSEDYEITELTTNIDIFIDPKSSVSSITIGFVKIK
tara:strand:- start:289 stop:783 length:495 start_codon:yes stop_codon:yes gene_type:complete